MTSGIQVRCKFTELLHPVSIGVQRQYESAVEERKPAAGFDERKLSPLCKHIEGAIGEYIVCKAKNWHWPATVGTFKREADIGDNIQVRSRPFHGWGLELRPNLGDPLDHVWVLVTGSLPVFFVRGWIIGHDAIKVGRETTFGNGRPACILVEPEDLRPMHQLTLIGGNHAVQVEGAVAPHARSSARP